MAPSKTSRSGRKPKKLRAYNEFGETVANNLAATCSSQTKLAQSMGTTVSYVNHFMTGRRSISPEWCNLVADALNLDGNDRLELHRAAARSMGFDIGPKLDLTKK